MPVDSELRKMMAQTIYVARVSSTLANVYGGKSWDTPDPFAARVEPKRRTHHSATGDEVISDFLVLTETRIGLTDRVWLPGDSTTAGRGREPKSVFEVPDEDGTISHYEVYV